MKPIVFISCGQRKDTEEVKIAKQVAETVSCLGYEPYIAVHEQSTLGIRENVFKILNRADYYLFIDLKRDKVFLSDGLSDEVKESFRGSLITHQELAIASFLELPTIAFQESGVAKLDGLIGLLQLNCIEFSDRNDLPKMVEEEFRRKFNCSHQNKLIMKEMETSTYHIPHNNRLIGACGHFISIENGHPQKYAKDSIVFIESIIRQDDGSSIDFEKAELKWCGITFPNVTILPLSFRQFEACFYLVDNNELFFPVLTDSQRHIPKITSEGVYKIQFSVNSEGFPPLKISTILEYKRSPGKIEFYLE